MEDCVPHFNSPLSALWFHFLHLNNSKTKQNLIIYVLLSSDIYGVLVLTEFPKLCVFSFNHNLFLWCAKYVFVIFKKINLVKFNKFTFF